MVAVRRQVVQAEEAARRTACREEKRMVSRRGRGLAEMRKMRTVRSLDELAWRKGRL
jgi:hypothetical protein